MTSILAPGPHPHEPHGEGLAGRLNWLRAGVLGANDGIVSVAAIVVGVAGATSAFAPIVDALAAHLAAELNIVETDVASPWQAAGASGVAFTVGALLPMAAILVLPASVRIPVTFAVVLAALAITGATSARIGGSPVLRATLRVVVGGALALGATFAIGSLLGTTGVV